MSASAAERMRRYRAPKRLRRVLQEPHAAGVDVEAVYAGFLESTKPEGTVCDTEPQSHPLPFPK